MKKINKRSKQTYNNVQFDSCAKSISAYLQCVPLKIIYLVLLRLNQAEQ